MSPLTLLVANLLLTSSDVRREKDKSHCAIRKHSCGSRNSIQSSLALAESHSDLEEGGSAHASCFNHHDRFHKFRPQTYHAPNIERILLLSDLHCDYAANRRWLENMCSRANNHSNTMILIAGDVSHNLSILQWTFRTLKQCFDEVCFVPGNHDLWLDKPRKHKPIATKLDSDYEVVSESIINGAGDGCNNSIEKLEKVLQLCIDQDVRIGPVKVESEDMQSVLWVVPLLSYYHQSFDSEPPIECWGGIPSTRKVVADYRKAKWPEPLSQLDDSVALFMDGLNDVILDCDFSTHGKSTSLLTFSHFLPRIDLVPEKRYLTLPTLHSCMGSTYLESRIRELKKQLNKSNITHLHAFGHSHLSWDQLINGIRYVHVPLAYPKEWEQRRRSLEIGTMHGEISDDRFPVCIWERQSQTDANGFPDEWLGGWWSKYYHIIERRPHLNKQLAPWAAKRFRKLPGGLIEDFDHMKVEMEHKLQHPSYWKAGSGSWYNHKGSK